MKYRSLIRSHGSIRKSPNWSASHRTRTSRNCNGSAFRRPRSFENLFLEMMRREPSPWPQLDWRFFTRGFTGRFAFSDMFYRRIGVPQTGAKLPSEALARESRVKHASEPARNRQSHFSNPFERNTKSKISASPGGLFLNPLLVSAIEHGIGFKDVFVQPAAGNEGTAPGAAWNEWHARRGQKTNHARIAPISHLYLGPATPTKKSSKCSTIAKPAYHWTDSDAEKISETAELAACRENCWLVSGRSRIRSARSG